MAFLAMCALACATAFPAGSEATIEQRFDAELNVADLNTWLKDMTAEPNHVGSPHDKANAELVRDQFRQWGWDARIEVFYALYPTLKHHTLELIAPTKYVAALEEPAIAGDATSARTDGLAPYLAYAGDGDVTGDLVYVNYGMQEDYNELARRGVDVRGRIVIARYGSNWRGLIPRLAQSHGAIGCIIYSDPQRDGYAVGEVYPKGSWRPAQSVQRGSVIDLPIYPGDPLTPGIGATKNAKRLAIADAKTILKIPAIAISYGDAEPLLAALEGPVAPATWRGALPITYHIGPGPAKVHLEVTSDWSLKPLYDVIAKIRGGEVPDEWILRGNHRDAWVFGAVDPLAGHGAMMAEAKAIGALMKAGWHPRRTLVYASWDGEEPGLLGSTEWAEAHAEELRRKAVVYVNSDVILRGFVSLSGSHSLQALANDVSRTVKDPETGVSVGERLRAKRLVDAYNKSAKLPSAEADVPMEALGSGSDFAPFLLHLGIASLNVEYAGLLQSDGGVSHSNYDSYDHYVRFGDPTHAYGIAEAQTVGHIVLRLADASVLPLQFGPFAATVQGYVTELHELADRRARATEDLTRLLDRDAFRLATDPLQPVLAPEREAPVPALNFAVLDEASVRLNQSAREYDDRYARFIAADGKLSATRAKRLNDLLRGMERSLTSERGLPGREWHKHLIYAPGLYTGYVAKTLPGVREAIEQTRWDDANRFIVLTAEALERYTQRLREARELL